MRAKITRKKIGELAAFLRAGGVGILPTDTIYGIVASACDRKAVGRVYRLRRRNPKKPVIILIASPDDLAFFGIAPGLRARKFLAQWWPGKVSVILPFPRGTSARAKALRARFAYLHRGTETLAFRVPKPRWLRALLTEAGPLVAPSANIEGMTPAATVAQAKKYFKKNVDFYLNKGRLTGSPSTLVSIKKGRPVVLREGSGTTGRP